jgi:hypothetical protein
MQDVTNVMNTFRQCSRAEEISEVHRRKISSLSSSTILPFLACRLCKRSSTARSPAPNALPSSALTSPLPCEPKVDATNIHTNSKLEKAAIPCFRPDLLDKKDMITAVSCFYLIDQPSAWNSGGTLGNTKNSL